jgi:hypothetical protein
MRMMLCRVFLLLPILASIAEVALATEEPKYSVVDKREGFEIRQYDPVVVAETLVEGEFGGGGNEGFRRLAGYIFGGNDGDRKIAMTAPVALERGGSREGTKIAMTAPVAQQPSGKGWLVSFTLPAEYKLTALPKPNDSRVTLREIPARRIAAVTFSGTWGPDRFEANEKDLREKVAAAGLTPAGPAIYARYNPPWTPWFLRRNEILLPVADPKSASPR